MAAVSSSSSVEELPELPPQHQVFINFRSTALHLGFVIQLVKALHRDNIKVFIDIDGRGAESLKILMNRIEESRIAIEESRIALVIFSGRYTESKFCLMELAKIADCVDKGKLVAIPIFYKMDPSTVRGLREQFGDAFRDLRERNERMEIWEEALKSISNRVGIKMDKTSDESKVIEKIVKEVKRALNRITLEETRKAYVDPSENSYTQTSSGGENDKNFGIKERVINGLKENVNRDKIRSHLGMIIGCLLLLFIIPHGPRKFAYMSTRLM